MENQTIQEMENNLPNIEVPDGYKVVIDPEFIETQRKSEERERLEAELLSMEVPSDEDLISLAKLSHPYYECLRKIEEL